MKSITLLFGVSLCLVPLAALAQGLSAAPPVESRPVCIEADNFHDYNARPVGRHEVAIHNAMGSDHRGLRLFTTCTYIDPIATISVHSFSKCVSMGDEVSAFAIGGHRELCRVARVEPFVEGSVKPPYK